MSIFDMFKSKWSPKLMSEDDRRRLFWYLKRKSSYTAWKTLADAFDRFAELFERQVREQPIHVPDGLTVEWGTNWEMLYSKVLKGQVLYEQGLERLRRGDRTVWLYNDLGVLDDASNVADYWYMALVNHGPHGDVYFDGKYIDQLTASIETVGTHLATTAGVLQSIMADAPAFDAWSRERMAGLSRRVPFPSTLPEVPVPESDVAVRTGESLPCFGIYEPQVVDGCLNYLLEGVPAPQALLIDDVDGEFAMRSVTWKLIWEDRRYLDGTIPAEERIYFPPVSAPSATPTAAGDGITSGQTNEIVSISGMWAVADNISAREHFTLGDRLPQFGGRDVVWVWVSR